MSVGEHLNQQACLFVQSRSALNDLCQKNPAAILNLSNKHRSYVFILQDHFRDLQDFENHAHFNTVLPLNEVLTQFLTHTLDERVIDRPIVCESVVRHWIHDIDLFVLWPDQIEMKIRDIGPHVYFYKSLDFLDDKK